MTTPEGKTTTAGAAARLAREIEHHRKIASHAEEVWNWDSPAGRRRADRRAELFVSEGRLGPGRRALELGCGTGVFLERVAEAGASLHGIDLSQDLLRRARERVGGLADVALHCGDAERMPFADGTFDAVYGSSVLHHLDLERALVEAGRVLRPGGRLVFAEPNILNPQVAAMFKLGFLKERFAVSSDEMAFTRFRARSTLRRLGFRAVEVRPLDFLHPSIPAGWVDVVSRVGEVLERLPLVREISGSMLIVAEKAVASGASRRT